jgi:NDP-sugar pyrophosphorylase family protein
MTKPKIKTVTKTKASSPVRKKSLTKKVAELSALNLVIPMAGAGKKFQEAGYTFPKPLIDIKGKTMIELVVHNLKPKFDHTFVFICHRDAYEKYDLHNILKRATDNKFEVVPVIGQTQGAACAVLCGINHINNNSELIIANSDQIVDFDINHFIATARAKDCDGLIVTFEASHPKWSYARADKNGKVFETAEKKVISNNATAGIYYFKKGSDFVRAAQGMIHKDIKHNNEFYVCPSYNELIIEGKQIYLYPVSGQKMQSLGTPEDVESFIKNS